MENIKELLAYPWAIRRSSLNLLCEYAKSGDYKHPQQEIEAASRSGKTGGNGSVAVLPINGVIAPQMSLLEEMFFGGVSLERLTPKFRNAVNDPQTDAVVLAIHSPGGSVFGVQEFADEVFSARKLKPIVAVANAEAASAAFWIGSAASEFLATPSSVVGSVGVIAVHDDFSEFLAQKGVKTTYITSSPYKAEGNPDEPLTDEARDNMQQMVDDYDRKFVHALARNRGVTVSTVRSDFGQGRVLTADDALKAGMVDRIGTIDEAIHRAGSGKVAVAAESHDVLPAAQWAADRRARLAALGY